jgi:hypothetical protein
LDAEITTASGKTKRGGRNSRLDSEHEPGEPVVGSLLKLGIEVAQSTVAKYLRRPPRIYRVQVAMLSIHTVYYNFGRILKTLRITPAMAASLSDHVWSLEEIAGLAK